MQSPAVQQMIALDEPRQAKKAAPLDLESYARYFGQAIRVSHPFLSCVSLSIEAQVPFQNYLFGSLARRTEFVTLVPWNLAPQGRKYPGMSEEGMSKR
jgi:hypothetical protein